MTASRLEGTEGLDVRRISSEARLFDQFESIESSESVVVVIDLTAFPNVPERLLEEDFREHAIIAFAPHVQEELLEAARPSVDLALPRGAVVKRLRTQVERAIERRAGNAAPGQER
jgi:hypothetical protein